MVNSTLSPPISSTPLAGQADLCVNMGRLGPRGSSATSGCVRGSVQDGSAYGFHMIVPRECVGDRSQTAHENSLFDIDQKLGDVVSMEETLEYLRGLE